jgi:hypothetical protein
VIIWRLKALSCRINAAERSYVPTEIVAASGTQGRFVHSQTMAPSEHPPDLAFYLVVQAALGVGIGLLFALIVYATDLNGLGSLLASAGPVATLIFFLSSAMTFAPFVVATAIGLLGFDNR